MVSSAAADAFGAVGGAVLAFCLLPQLWKLWRTQSARDISLSFVAVYLLAMLFSFLYLYYEDALVAWICAAAELACILIMIFAKIYYDSFGPNRWRSLGPFKARPEAHLTTSPSHAKEVGVNVQNVGSPFSQLLRATPTHAAQHLLLDARLLLPAWQADATADSASAGGANSMPGLDDSSSTVADANSSSKDNEEQCAVSSAGVLTTVGQMLEAALTGAGLPVRCRQAQAFASFCRCRPAGVAAAAAAAAAEAEAAASPSAPDLLFLTCRDGYATVVWHPSSATLLLDLLAASDVAVAAMAQAAHAFCERLVTQWPGSRIEASSVARLPRHPDQQATELKDEGSVKGGQEG